MKMDRTLENYFLNSEEISLSGMVLLMSFMVRLDWSSMRVGSLGSGSFMSANFNYKGMEIDSIIQQRELIECLYFKQIFKFCGKQQPRMMNDYEYLFKFIMVGDSNVGKSCLLMRFIEGRFRSQHEPTLGVQFGSKLTIINDHKIKLQIWDTAGQQSFKSITRAYYKGSIAAILVYDITKEKTFYDIGNWLSELKNHSNEKIIFVLVGNKLDLEKDREISRERAEEFAKSYGINMYYQTSALSGENAEKFFFDLAGETLSRIERGIICPDVDTAYGVKRGKSYRRKSLTAQLQLSKKKEKIKPENQGCAC